MNREVRIDSESSTDVITVQQLKDWGKVPSGAEDHDRPNDQVSQAAAGGMDRQILYWENLDR
jgi:hypothetical protein